jgi:hypothetical protein
MILGNAAPDLWVYFGKTLSIFLMILSAQWPAAATSDSVRGSDLTIGEVICSLQVSGHKDCRHNCQHRLRPLP